MFGLPVRRFVALIVVQLLPIALFFALNVMRPDLIAPVLAHELGYRWVYTARALWLVQGAGLFAAARFIEGQRAYAVVSTLVFVLLGLPLLACILFGPIVFAFTYGQT